jgi:predicted secreted Zn-dependent protease
MGGESEEEISWHVAGRCDSGQCVQVGTQGRSILIRSTVDPDGTFATLSRDEWQVFIAGVKDGDFDSI